MEILFVHQNFPAQFLHLATRLAAIGHRVAALGGPTSRPIPNVPIKFARYERLARGSTKDIHPLALRFEADCLRAEAAAVAATRLAGEGFSPDVIVGHDGWGELFLLTEIWPKARVLAYAEYYNQRHGADFSFDTEFKPPDRRSQLRAADAQCRAWRCAGRRRPDRGADAIPARASPAGLARPDRRHARRHRHGKRAAARRRDAAKFRMVRCCAPATRW